MTLTIGLGGVIVVLVLLIFTLHNRYQKKVAQMEIQIQNLKKQFRLAVAGATVAMGVDESVILEMMRSDEPIDVDTVSHKLQYAHNGDDDVFGNPEAPEL